MDMNSTDLMEKLQECSFETIVPLDISTLKALPEVRSMCEVNTCGMYDKRWSCPPGCGSIEECDARMKQYQQGILVQTVGDIEDSLDWEGIMEVKEIHDQRFLKGTEILRRELDDLLPLGDGSCNRCSVCAYPDQPCRFPELASASMEAFGLYVADVCKKNHTEYNYGPGKMCYTGCYLFH